jgi:hypothetical protein
MCTFDLPEIASIEGPFSSSYYGVSTSILDSTVTTTYNSKYLDYYSVYLGTWTVSYIKDNDNVSSIGKTTDTCDVYKYYDGTSYISTTCNVTLPDITPIGGYKVSGWYDYGDSKVGDPSDSISLNSNTNYVAKVVKEYYASHFSYDNSDTEVDCDDVACMLDELYVMSDSTVASHFSYDNSNTGVECSDVACMLDELYVMSDSTVASHFSYDNSNTGVNCSDVACMLDELFVMSDSTVASHFSYDNSNTGVECSDVACMLDELFVMSDSTVASHFSYDNSNTGVECNDVACMLDELYKMTG